MLIELNGYAFRILELTKSVSERDQRVDMLEQEPSITSKLVWYYLLQATLNLCPESK